MSETDDISNRIDQYDSIGSLIKGFGDISKSLLACSVPNIESDLAVFDHYPFDFEVDSYRTEIFCLEGVFAISN